MSTGHLYEVELNWSGLRMGTLSSPDLTETIQVATPPQFPGGLENIWSPEHLFTAAVNSCLMTTFLAVAEYSKFEFEHFSSKALGKLEMVDGKYVMSEVTLLPVLTIGSEEQREKALKVLQKAEAACLISNSVRSRIIFEPEIVISAIAGEGVV